MTREEAIKEIREWDFLNEKETEAIQTLIPELRESDDERIRMALIEYFAAPVPFTEVRGIPIQKVRDWFEKQKEQKPAEKQDYSGLNDLERAIHRGSLAAGVENVPVTIIKETAKECLTKMKPAEWSEEDDEHIDAICRALTDNMSNIGFYTTEALCSWLKSLRPSWKPSEEQMEALKEASASWMNAKMGNAKLLKSLYEQLEKL